ncbi:response regulator transcription factor [Vallitalea okinawensis]|uniref:response regulator transcription factor n=1 Tax=Vallitalea okinawensis TaxID=2078660 RepID=UPI0014787137|nr:response regulator transcription factor [Vallitalea okinawensis]
MELKVLVVEDNKALNDNIVDVLGFEGYESVSALNFSEAKKKIKSDQFHIILLDIMFPGGSGYQLIPLIREKSLCARILMLTALNDIESKRICYENGADDYITKPFDLKELVYKLNAIRRRVMSNMRVYHIGDIVFDLDLCELRCKEKIVTLSPSQVKIFKLLHQKYLQKTYLDKKEIFDTDIDESHRIQTFIGRLRNNLAYIRSERVYIETIYGKGYQLDVVQFKNEIDCK